MKHFFFASVFSLLAAGTALASPPECKSVGNAFRCETDGGNYTVNNVASAAAAAEAVAKAEQEQAQGQVQGQTSNNSNSFTATDESIDLATPAGGGCTWGVNFGLPGTGGAGVCGTTKNETAIALSNQALALGKKCLAEHLLLTAPMAKRAGIKPTC